ncbi:hypothetical protein BJ982_000122 [Sphaerisporangium siamense]|uniref:Uncharacterized protein n=1 Tax=Sphaerisporangium siamense TaxID=795645 RepID=A0A7W7D1J0_9ACTN|nr:hypothetical protein [Sphaerisporangium siamense]
MGKRRWHDSERLTAKVFDDIRVALGMVGGRPGE